MNRKQQKSTDSKSTRTEKNEKLKKCGERAETDHVEYLRLESEIGIPVLLVGDFNDSEHHPDKLEEYQFKMFNLFV